MAQQQKYDLLVVMDATASMGSFLDGLAHSTPEILGLSTLSGAFDRLGVIAYRDYSDGSRLLEWSDWQTGNDNSIIGFTGKLRPIGGGDIPEAAKTGLVKALDVVDPQRQTLILWYADAPPHHPSQLPESGNRMAERLAFAGKRTIDWVKLAYEAKAKQCMVFSFVNVMYGENKRFFVFLSQVTGGRCFQGPMNNSLSISKLTMDVLLTWLGHPPEGDAAVHGTSQVYFKKSPPAEIGNLDEEKSGSYLPAVTSNKLKASPLTNIVSNDLELTTKAIPQSTFKIDHLTLSRRFSKPDEEEYRTAVYAALKLIINSNVAALTYNPVFGQLWRAVCKYRGAGGDMAPEREELVNLFSLQVSKITDPARAAVMKEWLENSYDSSEMIEDIIKEAPGGADAPRMYLDLDSFGEGGVDLTRMELLEVARSCASSVMAKLANIFTHAKLVEPDVKLAPQQRSIPLTLPPQKLFEILPHLVIPGTMFSARPARIMAILATVVGVPFLLEPAAQLLTQCKGTWVDLKVPENLSYEFARFVLRGTPNDLEARLTEEEQQIYNGMRTYRLLELNIDASLTAKIGWTPEKSRGVGDDRVRCTKCEIMRSKTMMSNNPESFGVCGICADTDHMDPKAWNNENEDEACWVECSKETCRAQYTIVNVAGLKVRPKCWYCRNDKPCPYLECTRCLNRVIIPTQYQESIDKSTYLCIPCAKKSKPTIVDVETKARELVDKNGLKWLGLPEKAKWGVFTNRSAFKLAEANGPEFFKLTEPIISEITLGLNSKRLHEIGSLMEQVFRRVKEGTVELGTCTLCFENAPHAKLVPACGRSGCSHRVDDECLKTWYGANEPGHLLTVMRLKCPFCRRAPSAKTLSKYNPAAAALCGLKEALEDHGLYYAWCSDCGFAKRALERACCDGDRLPQIRNFACETCQDARRERARIAAAEAERHAAEAAAARGVRRAAWEAAHNPVREERESTRDRLTECPKCTVMVEKTFGCNHITCNCGAHFCHVCGHEDSEEGVYAHLNAKHGGIYDWDDE